MSEEQLLKKALGGDEAAFTALYRARQPGVFRFALHMSGSAAVAEDVTQEAFLALLRGSVRYEAERGSVAAFLYGIARNYVLRHLEKEREPAAEEAEPAADGGALDDLLRSEAVEAVRAAVLALPVHYREVVALCELEEMDYAQAAAALGCAVGTVRSRLHRARVLLAEKLDAMRPSRCSL